MVHTKDMLVQCLQGRPMEVKALIQEPLFVPPETMPALKLLEHWRGYRFEVVDMDWPRVDKVLVAPGPGADPMP